MKSELPRHDSFLKQLAAQCNDDSHRWFPSTADDVFYITASMAGEAGECLNEAKKVRRGSVELFDARDKILEEAADTLVYCMNIFGMLDADPMWWYNFVRAKNIARFGKHSPKLLENFVARGGGVLRIPEAGPRFQDEIPAPPLERMPDKTQQWEVFTPEVAEIEPIVPPRPIKDNPQA